MEIAREPFDDERRQAVATELCRTAREFHARGWCVGTSGNLSAVLSRSPLRLLITPSGRDKGRFDPSELLLVGEGGEVLGGSVAVPSAEELLHRMLVELVSAGSVLHTHSVAGTLLGEHFLERGGFTLGGYEMLKGLSGVDTHETEVFVPVVANSQDIPQIGEQVRRLLGRLPSMRGFLIAGHGLYTWGESTTEARRHVEVFEFLFECVARRTSFVPFTGDAV